jgi:uncharacterized LabA/DUF88 family protein
MDRIAFFVDGFNLYHALREKSEYHKYKWLDLSKLCAAFTMKKDKVVDIYYFTALTTWNQPKIARHKDYIRALESKNVHIIYGEFKRRDKLCPLCKKTFHTFEEKQTDVNVAIYLFKLAIQDSYDTAIIISGDSDLIPSLSAVRTMFPNKRLGVIIPIGRASESLKQTAHFHMKMKQYHLQSSLFPAIVNLGQNQTVTCPESWRMSPEQQ